MRKKRKGFMTLAEHDALLKAEGRYDAMVERQRQQEKERLQRVAEWRRAEDPLVRELQAAGYAVESAWDLVNTATPYPKALPILMDHLSRPYPGPVREGIARALAVPEAKFGWSVLTGLYRGEQDNRAKDGLAAAIAAAADDEVIGDVIALAQDTRHGPSRLLLLSALERSRDKRARMALMDLGTDPELKKEIDVILRRLKRARRGPH
jgi:hypothetical protein